jgi:hypothetical protein
MIQCSIDRARSHGRAAGVFAVISVLLLSACAAVPEPAAALTAVNAD